MNLNDLRMSLKAALDNMWARIDARITAIEQGGGGSGVTGVKGNAEASYRQGNVNLTPADIGAVNKAGDTMTGPLDIRQFLTAWAIELIPQVGSGIGGYIDFSFNGEVVDNTSRIIEGARGVLNINGINFDRANPFISIPNGGTGATTPAGARANLHAMQNPDTSTPQYGTGNFNDAPVGFSAWYGPNCVNAPFQAWTSVLTMNFIVGYVQQIAFSWYGIGNQIAYRNCDNGTWNAWKYIALS